MGTNRSRVESSVVTASGRGGASCGCPAMPLWRLETYNSGGRGGGCRCKVRGRRGEVEGNGTGRGLGGPGMSESYWRRSGLSQSLLICFRFTRKRTGEHVREKKYESMLDGKVRPDSLIEMFNGVLRVRVVAPRLVKKIVRQGFGKAERKWVLQRAMLHRSYPRHHMAAIPLAT